jgi:GT2 family glycosyltransferase
MTGDPRPPVIVFVNYRSEQLIAPRAERLLAAGFDVVVADNSGTYAGPGTTVDPGGNVGFGAGCNAAIASLDDSVSVVVLHNPDVDATPEVVRELCDRLRAQARPGLLGPAVREGQAVRTAGFQEPGIGREALLSLAEVLGRNRAQRERTAGPTGARRAVRGKRFASAALLAVDLDALRSVGGFDPELFLYGEDLDLWHRVQDAGRTVGFAEDLVVDHAHATGSPLGALDRAVLRWVGIELFAARHRRWSWPLFRLAHLPAAVLARRRGPLPRVVAASWFRGRHPRSVAREVRERAAAQPR